MENIKLCKNCGKEHNGTYGKGDFCSLHCSRSYSGKLTKQHSKGVKRPKINYICPYCGQNILGQVDFRKHKTTCSEKSRDTAKKGGWSCDVCGGTFRTRRLLSSHKKTTICGNFGKSQVHPLIDFTCQFCNKIFIQRRKEYKTQHENHCECNPNAIKYRGHPHTDKSKQYLSSIAKKNKLGGWHTSRRFYYNGIRLDSTYELTFAKSLDSNNVKWKRPEPFLYRIGKEEHRYYPDFFLPEYGVYVDTKNDYLMNHVNPRYGLTDKQKIDLVSEQNDVKIFILDKDNLSWEKLKTLL